MRTEQNYHYFCHRRSIVMQRLERESCVLGILCNARESEMSSVLKNRVTAVRAFEWGAESGGSMLAVWHRKR